MDFECAQSHVRGADFSCFVRVIEKFMRPNSPKIRVRLSYSIISSELAYQIEPTWLHFVDIELSFLALVRGFYNLISKKS